MVEGPRATDGALASGAVLEAVFARPELVGRYACTGMSGDHPDSARLGASFRSRIGAAYVVPADVLDPLADAMNPQGVLGVARFADAPLEEAAQAQRVVVLEAVRDPGNAGAVVRSAAAAGFGSVIATAGTTDLWSPKALRGAAGLTFGLRVCRGHTTGEVLAALGAAGHLRVRAAADAELTVDQFAAQLADAAEPVCEPAAAESAASQRLGSDAVARSRPMTLVLGNEAHGPSSEAVAGTDLALAVPMRHPVDSLNVAVAAALLMYAMRP